MDIFNLSEVIADRHIIDQGDVDKTPFLEGAMAKDFWNWYNSTFHQHNIKWQLYIRLHF